MKPSQELLLSPELKGRKCLILLKVPKTSKSTESLKIKDESDNLSESEEIKPVESLKSESQKKSSKNDTKKVASTKKFSAVLTRFLLLLHTSVAIWRVSLDYDKEYLYFVSIGAFMLLIEMIVTLAVRGGNEMKWFSPSVFFYLLSVIPCLWFLEIAEIRQIAETSPQCNNSNFNISTEKNHTLNDHHNSLVFSGRHDRSILTLENSSSTMLDSKLNNTTGVEITEINGINETSKNEVKTLGQHFKKTFKDTVQVLKQTKDEMVKQVKYFLSKINLLGSRNWKLAIHQTLIFVLVIGRWLFPIDEITRDELSQLLLVFIGIGGDILEFVTETLEEDKIHDCNFFLVYFLYMVWTVSLFQFTLVMTASKSRKTRIGFGESGMTKISRANNCCARSIFNSAEVWGILVTLCVQDIPFFSFRLYMILAYQEVQQMMIFFTGKNALVIMLQMYRLVVLKLDKKSSDSKKFRIMKTI